MAKDDLTPNFDNLDAEISVCPWAKDFVFLTPQLFRELNLIARAHGCVIEVQTEQQTKGAFALDTGWAIGVYLDDRITEVPGCAAEVSGFSLCNQIDLQRFASIESPAIPYNKIPPELVYHFLTWRQIGLKRGGYGFADFLKVGEHNKQWLRLAASYLSGAYADRFAWRALFHNKPWWTSKQELRNFRATVELYKRDLRAAGVRHRKAKPKQYPAGEHSFVPVSHIRHGIPWADPTVRPVLHGLKWQGIAMTDATPPEEHHDEARGKLVSAGFFNTRDEADVAARAKCNEIQGIGYYLEQHWLPVAA